MANAGVSTMQHVLELTDDEWDVNFNVNARGVFLINQIVARHFVRHGKSCIVNTASLAAKVSAPLLARYSASKFAVLAGRKLLHASSFRKAYGSTPCVPDSLGRACRRVISTGRPACAACRPNASSRSTSRRPR
jgi:NADP-dependent 3-hydroxy acid dehydrogenase YdfG